MRAAIYRRVSQITVSNIEGSMADQLAKCRAYIAQHGWTEVRDYEESGKSAYNEKSLTKRTAYQRMLQDAKDRLFDVVIVYKYDRFSRRTRIALEARYQLEQLGVDVESVSEPFDTTTAAGRFGVRNMISVAELFSDMLSERMKSARASEAARGRHLGPIPVGYISQGRGNLTHCPPYDAMVIQACTLYAPGQLSPSAIASALNDAGYTMPTGRPLIAQDVRRILSNAPLYAGMVQSGGVWIPGNHEPILDAQLSAQVVATFARRGRAQDRRFVRTNEPTALLAGLIYCGACEAKMHYSIDKRRDPPWRAYRCKTHADGGACDAPYAPAGPLETTLLGTLSLLGGALDDWMDEALAIASAQLQAAPSAPTATDPARVQEKVRRLARAYADGAYTDEEYTAQRAALLAQLESSPSTPARPRVTLRDVAGRLLDIPALLQSATVGEQRAVLAECIDQVFAFEGAITAIRPTILFEPILVAARDRVTEPGYLSTSSNAETLQIPAFLPARSGVQL